MGRKFEFEFVPFTTDQIRAVSEEDLYKNINRFKRLIREASRSGKTTETFEVELCYLDHERIMREKTRESHGKFLNRRPKKASKASY